MKKAYGIIEILIGVLLISIIVAISLRTTITQSPNGEIEHTKLQEAEKRADDIIENINNIKEQNVEYQRALLNNSAQ